MTKLDRLKNIKGYVSDLIYNIKIGNEMDGYQAIIKYKDGTIKYISENEDIENVSLNLSKIDYIVYDDPDTSRDSEGKCLDDLYISGTKPIPQTALDTWQAYINTKLNEKPSRRL